MILLYGLGIVLSLLPLAAVAAIVFVVVRGTTRDAGGVDLARMARRFFVYGLLFLSLVLAAEGLRQVLGLVVPGGPPRIAGDETAVAGAVSLLVVGGAAWAALRFWVGRSMTREPEERASLAWILYLDVVLAVAVVVVLVTGSAVLRALFGVIPFAPNVLAGLVVWAGIWAYHARAATDEHTRPERANPFSDLFGSAAGLVAAALGVAGILAAGFDAAYGFLTGARLVAGGGTDPLLSGVAIAAVGGVVWGFHWLVRGTVRARRTLSWLAYVLLLPLLGGAIAVLVSSAGALYVVLVWFLGRPETAQAAVHFSDLATLLAAAVVGGAVWGYHHDVLGRARPARRSEPERVAQYLLAALGLVAMTAAVVMLLTVVFDAVGGVPLARTGGINAVLGAVTALVVGGPVWGWHWDRIRRHEADPAELRSPSRRVYLMAIFGIAGLVVLLGLIVVLRGLLGLLLGGGAGSFSAPLAMVIAALALAGFHGQVWRTDRRRLATATPRPPRRSVVLAVADAERLATALRAATDLHVRPLPAAGPAVALEEVVAALEATEEPHVLLVRTAAGLETVPLR